MTPACVTKSRLSCLAAWLQGWYRKKTHLPGQLPVILSSENGLWKWQNFFHPQWIPVQIRVRFELHHRLQRQNPSRIG